MGTCRFPTVTQTAAYAVVRVLVSNCVSKLGLGLSTTVFECVFLVPGNPMITWICVQLCSSWAARCVKSATKPTKRVSTLSSTVRLPKSFGNNFASTPTSRIQLIVSSTSNTRRPSQGSCSALSWHFATGISGNGGMVSCSERRRPQSGKLFADRS